MQFAIQHHLSGESIANKEIERKGSEDQHAAANVQDVYIMEGGHDAIRKRPVESVTTSSLNNNEPNNHSHSPSSSLQQHCRINKRVCYHASQQFGHYPKCQVFTMGGGAITSTLCGHAIHLLSLFEYYGQSPHEYSGMVIGYAHGIFDNEFGVMSVLGVALAKPIMLGMNEGTFVKWVWWYLLD